MQGYIAALCAVSSAAAYLAGYTRGEMYGERTQIVTVQEVVEYPPAYAATCAAMMDAALGETRVPASSPHEP